MTNYMKEVVNLLGVEDEEIFQIGNDTSLKNSFFQFSDGFLYMSNDIEDGSSWEIAADGILIGLIYGNLSICKLPWKPALEELYYTPDIFNREKYDIYTWDGEEYDEKPYKRGLVFKTKEEAIAMTEKLLAVVKEERDKWLIAWQK